MHIKLLEARGQGGDVGSKPTWILNSDAFSWS